MAIRTELTLRLQNSPGTLARVCQVVAEEHINIVAINLASPLMVRILVDNPTHAAGVLQGAELPRRGARRDLHDCPERPGRAAAASRG